LSRFDRSSRVDRAFDRSIDRSIAIDIDVARRRRRRSSSFVDERRRRRANERTNERTNERAVVVVATVVVVVVRRRRGETTGTWDVDYERRTFARRASRARERGGDGGRLTSALARRVSERSSRVMTDES